MGSSQYLRKYLPQSNLLATIQQLRATITHSLQMSLKTLPLLWEYLYHYQELYSQCFRSGRERGQSRELPPKGGKISPRDLLGLAGAHALHTGTSLPHLSLDHMQKTRWAGHTNYIFFQFPKHSHSIYLICFSKYYEDSLPHPMDKGSRLSNSESLTIHII